MTKRKFLRGSIVWFVICKYRYRRATLENLNSAQEATDVIQSPTDNIDVKYRHALL